MYSVKSIRPKVGSCMLLVVLVLAACSPAPGPEVVRIAAAANLSSVGNSLGAAFSRTHPAFIIEWSHGSSGALLAQLQQGAPAEVFLSADVDFAQRAFDAGLATSPPRVYARGALVLLSTQGHDLSKGLAILTDPSVARFALANPDTAPYGRAAREVLTAAGLWDRVQAKAVYGQSITQAKQMLTSATGIGLINQSALFADDLAPFVTEQTHWIPLDPASYTPIDQALVLLRGAGRGAEAFVRFLSGPEAHKIFADAGYLPVPTP